LAIFSACLFFGEVPVDFSVPAAAYFKRPYCYGGSLYAATIGHGEICGLAAREPDPERQGAIAPQKVNPDLQSIGVRCMNGFQSRTRVLSLLES